MLILKDDGCNTNIMSADFVDKNRDDLDLRRMDITIAHSDKDVTEQVRQMVCNATIEINDRSLLRSTKRQHL